MPIRVHSGELERRQTVVNEIKFINIFQLLWKILKTKDTTVKNSLSNIFND